MNIYQPQQKNLHECNQFAIPHFFADVGFPMSLDDRLTQKGSIQISKTYSAIHLYCYSFTVADATTNLNFTPPTSH